MKYDIIFISLMNCKNYCLFLTLLAFIDFSCIETPNEPESRELPIVKVVNNTSWTINTHILDRVDESNMQNCTIRGHLYRIARNIEPHSTYSGEISPGTYYFFADADTYPSRCWGQWFTVDYNDIKVLTLNP